MNAITLIWRQVLKELKLFQMKKNKEDAAEKTEEEQLKTPESEGHEHIYTAPLPDTAPPTGKKKETEQKQPVRLTQEVRTFLQKQYDFRYNLLTEETEYRPANKRAVPFEPVSKRELNTFCMEAHDQGISCWDKDLSRYIYSTCIPEYHPFRLYMEELPGWDGTDRLEALAQRVSDNQLWIKSFHTWMLGLTAQWLGMTGIHANSVAPILVSSEQGRQKSTFCKALMPPALSRYYMDNLKLSAQGKPERLLAEMGLLNMDEFDKYGTQQMPLLKNLMQMANLNICKAYQKNFRNLPRIASFIGTSNRFDLLTDPTGSRRFICIEAEHLIDCEGIMHDQIYAQLKAELLSGIRYWFTKEEERELQRHNAAFYHPCPAEEVFHACFRIAENDEEGSERLSASDIFRRLKMYNPAAMRGSNPATFAQVLLAAGVTRKHTKYGNVYLVKPMKAA
ncbi:VapE domain-containing protein [Bacteroides ovatus]|jgi:predicted P-loop ATPase|uniref:VapE domain-containing protein n=1 Tax=Bacteroides ovatus TaxID=28116 RepID=UPI0022E34880|nr:VapE domain-containing protein [Bacteroides ovatus]